MIKLIQADARPHTLIMAMVKFLDLKRNMADPELSLNARMS
jgi:hypothetical protein